MGNGASDVMGALCTPLQQMLAQAQDPMMSTVKPMSSFYDQLAGMRLTPGRDIAHAYNPGVGYVRSPRRCRDTAQLRRARRWHETQHLGTPPPDLR
jgi:hypothetical protein